MLVSVQGNPWPAVIWLAYNDRSRPCLTSGLIWGKAPQNDHSSFSQIHGKGWFTASSGLETVTPTPRKEWRHHTIFLNVTLWNTKDTLLVSCWFLLPRSPLKEFIYMNLYRLLLIFLWNPCSHADSWDSIGSFSSLPPAKSVQDISSLPDSCKTSNEVFA